MYDTILVPLDGSPFAEQVLPLAALVARRSGMAMELVTVHRTRPVGYGEGSVLAELDVVGRGRALSDEYLQRTAARMSRVTRVRVGRRLLDDPPPAAEAICGEAVRVGAAMIAMTTHGRTGILRAIRGSVADGVVKHAPVPVLLWRAADAPLAPARPPAHVLVALDGSTWSEMVLPAAAALASVLEARLTLLEVVARVPAVVPELVAVAAEGPLASDGAPATGIDDAASQRAVDRATAYVERTLERVRREHPQLTIGGRVVTHDRTAEAIVRTARDVGADVVAMTTHGRGGSRLVVGSTVDGVLARRSGATLLVRPTAPVPRN